MIIKAPRGTKDTLPEEVYKWHYIENLIRDLTATYGYREIRTPIFEHTELFVRGVGDTTDIVQKEMYTFLDKSDRSITLKPEGTAGVVRAYIEHGLFNKAQPIKTYYMTPVFRYEAPQAGRFRQHHQFGVEVFGAKDASIDAEIITIAMSLFDKLGIKDLKLNINSIGCKNCRPDYHKALKDYLKDHLEELCDSCNDRYEKNPLRVLDCKNEACQRIVKNAPVVLDFLCEECDTHFESLKTFLEAASLDYHINPFIVRGLDYYSKTVFEVISDKIGAMGTVCGGGRYDGLVEECGGPETPGIGFGLGLERLIRTLESENIEIEDNEIIDIYIVNIGKNTRIKAFELLNRLRKEDFSADMDHIGRSIKAQFKSADRTGARLVLILGEDELSEGKVTLRDMEDGLEELVALDSIVSHLKAKRRED